MRKFWLPLMSFALLGTLSTVKQTTAQTLPLADQLTSLTSPTSLTSLP